MAIPRGTPCACRFLYGRVFAGFRIYPGSVVFILVITTNPGNLSLRLCVYLPTARHFCTAVWALALLALCEYHHVRGYVAKQNTSELGRNGIADLHEALALGTME